MLRIASDVTYKPEDTSNKFEALVTTANDRVFGEMVKAQMAEERKKRKEKERREREAKEKADKEKGIVSDEKAGNQEDEVRSGNEEKIEKEDVQKSTKEVEVVKLKVQHPHLKLNGHLDIKDGDHTPAPSTPMSNVKMIDGEPVKDRHPVIEEELAVVVVPIGEDAKAAAENPANKNEKQEAAEMLIVKQVLEDIDQNVIQEANEAKGSMGKEAKHSKNDKSNKDRVDREASDKDEKALGAVGKREVKDEDKRAPEAKDKKAVDEKDKKKDERHRHHHDRPMDPAMEAKMLLRMFGPEAAGQSAYCFSLS